MSFDLKKSLDSLSVALGSGNTGALAAGAGAAGIVNEAQNVLAEKGSQIGRVLGSLGLSGFLASASAAADKSTTAQSSALQTAFAPNLGKYGALIGAALAAGLLLWKGTKSLVWVGAAGLGGFLIYKLVSKPSVTVQGAASRAQDVQVAKLNSPLDALGPLISGIAGPVAWFTASSPTPISAGEAPGGPVYSLDSKPGPFSEWSTFIAPSTAEMEGGFDA